MKRLWLTILLLTVAAVGFADPAIYDISQLPGNGTIGAGTQPLSDMSLSYLAQLFGSVGGILNSPDHVQLLQELFAIFNKAILALAVAWTSYTISTVVFNSAMEGGFITSQRKQAVFIFARLAIGFSLLVPLSSGYNGLQVLGMKAMLEGINLANKVWDETLVFIVHKGIFHDFSDKKNATQKSLIDTSAWGDPIEMSGDTDNKKNLTGTQGVVYNALCTAYYAKNASAGGMNYASGGPSLQTDTVGSTTIDYIAFPSQKSPVGCGTYRLTSTSGSATEFNKTQNKIEQNLIYNIWPLAQNIVQDVFSSDSSSDNNASQLANADAIVAALTDYVSSSQLNDMDNPTTGSSSSNTKNTAWETQAGAQGWLGAGRFYWLLSQSNWDNVSDRAKNGNPNTSVLWPKLASTQPGASKTKNDPNYPSVDNQVYLPFENYWVNAKGNTTKVMSYFDSLAHGVTTSIQQANAFSNAPAGTTQYTINRTGLCSAQTTAPAGVTLHSDLTNLDKYGKPDPGVISIFHFYQISDTSDLDALEPLGNCGSTSSTNPSLTYSIPVYTYADYVNAMGQQGTSGVNSMNGSFWQGNGTGFNGERLCTYQGVNDVDMTKSLGTQVGFCASDGAKFSTLTGENLTANAVSSPTFNAPFLGQVPGVMGVMTNLSHEFNLLEDSKSQSLTDPLYFMNQLGLDMLGSAGILWSNSYQYIYNFALAQGIMTGIAPGAQIFSGFLSWWEPVLITIAGGLFVAGFMLCFYAPLYPFVLYLLGAMNWLMVCVEFMIALPLVALGVTHPEGHDFLGKAEVALMLTLSACLRPVLMVFGFIGGLIMSFIAFSAVNYMFSSVLVAVFGNMTPAGFMGMGGMPRVATSADYQNTPPVIDSIFGVLTDNWKGQVDQAHAQMFSGSPLTDVLIIPLLMVFYGYIVIEVVHFCFSMIHQLPDQVLRWIGGPVAQDRTQQIADKLQHGMQSGAKQAGDLQGKNVTGAAKAQGGAVGGSIGAGIQVGMNAAKMAMGA